MPNLNIHVSEELNHFITGKVAEGSFRNADEVVRAALLSFEQEEQEYDAKLAALREAIAEGDASGDAEGDVIGRIKQEIRQYARNR